MALITPTDARRRWFGAFFIIISLGLLVWGSTFLADYLFKRPFLFVVYWAACALFTAIAALNALLDFVIMRKRTRDEQNALARQSLAEIEAEKKKRGLS
jgi:hypothetical protein